MTEKMDQQRVGRGEDAEGLTHLPFQAVVLLADSVATLFDPISLQRPKVLFPLVNAPILHYTLSWLESAGVEEVFLYSCAHDEQVSVYLRTSKWFDQQDFSVMVIESHNSTSSGDALRLIYEKNVIHGDFVLVTGDVVSNMSLIQALKEQKERRKLDSNAVMTMVTKQRKPSNITPQSCLSTEEVLMAIDPKTKQLLCYEDKADTLKGTVSETFHAHTSTALHNDMLDFYVDICSREVLSIFTENLDYQHLRHHFVKGLLLDDIMGYKIFTHEIGSSYTARVDNYWKYDTISRHIIQWWAYPMVPESVGNRRFSRLQKGMLTASDVGLPHSAEVGPSIVIGAGTTIGEYTKVSDSVIGRGCVIGSNVFIKGCYVWDNVTIEDNCKLKHAIICDGVKIKSGSVVRAGTILSFKVIIGKDHIVPPYSKVSLLKQPATGGTDEELEHAVRSSGNTEIPCIFLNFEYRHSFTIKELRVDLFDAKIHASEVGNGGAGFIWSVSGEEWRPSDEDVVVDNSDHYFQEKVEAAILKAVEDNVEEKIVIQEVDSLGLSHNRSFTHCVSALFVAIMKLPLQNLNPDGSTDEIYKRVSSVIVKWRDLLAAYFSRSIYGQVAVILKFERMCLETKEYSSFFTEVLKHMYAEHVLGEEAIVKWAAKKERVVGSDKIFFKEAEKFVKWLKMAHHI